MDWWHKAWKCPYFKWDDRQKVVCEGGCVQKFPDAETARRFMERYCASMEGWPVCSLSAALSDYYERKEKRDA